MIQTVIKRDGRKVAFDEQKITNAIKACFAGIPETTLSRPSTLASAVTNLVTARVAQHGKTPSVEDVQDAVEIILQANGEYAAAKAYILYREKKAAERAERPIPDQVQFTFDSASKYFATELQQFQYYSKYARYNYELGRRETWPETVKRAVNYLRELSNDMLPQYLYDAIHRAILRLEVMPSMRLLAMAGDAARRDNISIYNCAYMTVSDIRSFVEALTISMSGCGVGFSVESKYVQQLPIVKPQSDIVQETHVIEDSSPGWAEALRKGLNAWWGGCDIKFDYSLIRPAGAPLKTKGGQASGPGPLRELLDFTRSVILSRQGKKIKEH